MSARNTHAAKAARRAERRQDAATLLAAPDGRPIATLDTAHDSDAERWWILDPDGHRELQGRSLGLPSGTQAHGWQCTWCLGRIQTIAAPGAGYDGVLPIPVVEHATLCGALCPHSRARSGPGLEWRLLRVRRMPGSAQQARDLTPLITPNAELACKASEIARSADGLRRQAANFASMALSATETVADARSMLTAIWQGDLREAAVDLIGQLAAGDGDA